MEVIAGYLCHGREDDFVISPLEDVRSVVDCFGMVPEGIVARHLHRLDGMFHGSDSDTGHILGQWKSGIVSKKGLAARREGLVGEGIAKVFVELAVESEDVDEFVAHDVDHGIDARLVQYDLHIVVMITIIAATISSGDGIEADIGKSNDWSIGEGIDGTGRGYGECRKVSIFFTHLVSPDGIKGGDKDDEVGIVVSLVGIGPWLGYDVIVEIVADIGLSTVSFEVYLQMR